MDINSNNQFKSVFESEGDESSPIFVEINEYEIHHEIVVKNLQSFEVERLCLS